jgi:large-conductance mechanosensitive channel
LPMVTLPLLSNLTLSTAISLFGGISMGERKKLVKDDGFSLSRGIVFSFNLLVATRRLILFIIIPYILFSMIKLKNALYGREEKETSTENERMFARSLR